VDVVGVSFVGEGMDRKRSEGERWIGVGSALMVLGTCTVLVVVASEEGKRWCGGGSVLMATGAGTVLVVVGSEESESWGKGWIVGAVEVLLSWGGGTAGEPGWWVRWRCCCAGELGQRGTLCWCVWWRCWAAGKVA
jgi:hypothetical protein